MPKTKRKKKRESHQKIGKSKKPQSYKRRIHEANRKIQGKEKQTRIYSGIESHRSGVLEALNQINPLLVLFRQGVFFDQGTASDFIIKYYPSIRPLLEDCVDEYDWNEKSDPEKFVEWIFEKLSQKVHYQKWAFKEKGFYVIESEETQPEGFGFVVGGWYDIGKHFHELYCYLCRMMKLFVTKFGNDLLWKAPRMDGIFDMNEQNLEEYPEGEREEIEAIVNFYKKGEPERFAIDIMGSEDITIEQSIQILSELRRVPPNTVYTKRYYDFITWIHDGIVLVNSNSFKYSMSYEHEDLITSQKLTELQEGVDATEFFPFIWTCQDAAFEQHEEWFSDCVNNYYVKPFSFIYTPKEFIKNQKPDINGIKKWFTRGFKEFDYEPGKFKRSHFARAKHTLLRNILK